MSGWRLRVKKVSGAPAAGAGSLSSGPQPSARLLAHSHRPNPRQMTALSGHPPSSPPHRLPQSGFISASLALLGILLALFLLWALCLLGARRSAVKRWSEVAAEDAERARLLQASAGSADGRLAWRRGRVAYEWVPGARVYLLLSCGLVFGVNIFSERSPGPRMAPFHSADLISLSQASSHPS